MIELVYIPHDMTDDAWKHVEKDIADALARSNGYALSSSIKQWIKDKKMQLWMLWDQEEKNTQYYGVVVTGVVTATSFTGDGSNLTNVPAVSGGTIGVALAGAFVGAGVTMLDLGSNAGATLTTPSAGVTTFRTLGVSIGLAIALGS